MSKRMRNRKVSGFTLLEVLMVVAMLAIVGGAIITSYGGLEDKAAKGSATHTIAAVEEAFRVFAATEGGLPNNLESLLAATPTTPAYVIAEADNGAADASATGAAFAGLLGAKIAGKFTIVDTDPAPLVAAGITKIRYLDLKGNGTGGTLDIKDASGAATTVGDIGAISIPQHAFEAPRPTNKNRGRGYYVNAVGGTSIPLAVWNAGDGGYNNVKVGGNPTSVLVGLGLGNASSLIGEGVFTNLAHAPYYGNVAKNQYNHYVALVDVSVSPAKLVAIVDSRGDFLDEEFAEATGQKL
ncbi:MAG: prepilin-type N-terminal cleavage/methylation domain-containing protein [Planctomycetaceae bacterium]|nr:prepilin-type N-terminal cleavage/methylation domain-containing protein [Planctomycetaceae bacterium]